MLVSGREAIRILTPLVSGDAQARRVLSSGLAGPATATPRGPLYDERQVTALVARPVVDVSRLPELCPHGLYVARTARSTAVPVGAPWSALAVSVGQRPAMPPLTTALLSVRMTVWGGLPWVATLCGWVVLCAEARGFEAGPDESIRFRLDPPGSWSVAFDRHRLPTSRGGRPWQLWTPGLD